MYTIGKELHKNYHITLSDPRVLRHPTTIARISHSRTAIPWMNQRLMSSAINSSSAQDDTATGNYSSPIIFLLLCRCDIQEPISANHHLFYHRQHMIEELPQHLEFKASGINMAWVCTLTNCIDFIIKYFIVKYRISPFSLYILYHGGWT